MLELHLLLYLIVVGGGIVVMIKFLRIIHTTEKWSLKDISLALHFCSMYTWWLTHSGPSRTWSLWEEKMIATCRSALLISSSGCTALQIVVSTFLIFFFHCIWSLSLTWGDWVHLMSDSSWRCYLLYLIFYFTWSLGNWENDPCKSKLALELLWSPSMDAGGASKPQRHSQLADLQKRLSLPICKILILSISLFVHTIMCKSTILNCKQV